MKHTIVALLGLVLLVTLVGCGSPGAPSDEQDVSYLADPFAGLVGAVAMNPHPSSLEGTTVVLRWNGKPNGDVVLDYLGELLAQEGVANVIKLWEVDPDSAMISGKENIIDLGMERSVRFAEEAVDLGADLVIASQAD
jgi:hypothetical protein